MNPAITAGNLRVAAGTQVIALTTATVQLTAWGGNVGLATIPYNGNAVIGDPAVTPDLTNNRIKVNGPGVYLVMFSLTGIYTGQGTYTIQLRLNGATLQAGCLATYQTEQAGAQTVTLAWMGLVPITAAQGVVGGLQTFPNPPTTDPSGHPDFSGAGGAPTTETWLDLVVNGPNAGTVQIQNGDFTAVRVG